MRRDHLPPYLPPHLHSHGHDVGKWAWTWVACVSWAFHVRQVRTWRLDSFLEREVLHGSSLLRRPYAPGLPHAVAWLKVDAEGFDPYVLRCHAREDPTRAAHGPSDATPTRGGSTPSSPPRLIPRA